MLDPSTLLVFATAAIVILLIPGPSVLYIVSQSVEHGRKAGLLAVLGVHLGTLVHITAATVGLSALLVSSATLFDAVLVGAGYLIVLGVRAVLGRGEATRSRAPAAREMRPGRIVRRGILVNVTNPKTALFFFAFLPQFVRPGDGPVALQMAVLGLTFLVLGLITDGTWALVSGSAAGWVRARPAIGSTQRVVTGCIFIGLGVATAMGAGERRQ
jgi:threonine/homoserine/homoserine lactone efflux protein